MDEELALYVGEQIHPKYKLQAIDLLPPPIFDQTLYLIKNKESGLIDFRNLSSGERQIAYTISNFMYHLVNVDSEWNDFFHDKAHKEIIKYRYVNVIFDEVELYFHPELQRSFLGLLQQALQNAHFQNLRGVNIILATHSPFILSDIPHSNVLCLGEEELTVDGTFGANIIELLGNSFFLSSVIGNVASIEMKKVVGMYQRMKAGLDICKEYQLSRERFRYLEEYVSDPYMKMMTKRMVDELNDYNLKQKKNV
ncbi:ATP-binding protein [Bacteroidales bacterium OttesenSCG-928-L03]|nr:ATP-binding protein [Bacteroidales bacterium OttesenSCG-928-L03]